MEHQHKTIEDMLVEALAKLDQIETRQKVIELLVPVPQVLTIQNIAQLEGVSYTYITNAGTYLLPRYGESAFSGGHRRWPLDEYLEWRKKPIEERQHGLVVYRENLRKQNIEKLGLNQVQGA